VRITRQLMQGGTGVGIRPTAAIDSAGDLRAEIARRQLVIYELAPQVGLHPAHLGQVLRGRRPLTAELEARIRAALAQADEPERVLA
jgi:plasmid maintenance system antidote protein VapI